MDPVVHFEMGYNDRDRMASFYEKAFDWKMQKYGPEMGNYVVAHTTETDEKGMTKTPGQINGGFYSKAEASPEPSVVISVKDIKASMKKIEEAGGKILGAKDKDGKQTMEPVEIPGVGLWITFEDTEGNRASIMQPNEM